MQRVLAILGTILIGCILLYVSRFWIWQAPWGKDGLFGIKLLSPNGDVLRRALRGTSFSAFDMVLWFGLVCVSLSAVQWINDKLSK